MPQFGELQEFPIRRTIEQQPFLSPAVQSFFTEWCRINDSIKPEFISRSQWLEKSKNFLVKNLDNSRTLYLPENLKLWEMVGAIEAVDHDTFKDNPQRRDEVKNKLLLLGKTFQNAGTYIAQRINAIDKGREVAENLAKELYSYGASLATGNPPRQESLETIAALPLSPSETETVDRFLSGETLYTARKGKAEDAEAMRRKTLAQFFRVSEKAFQLDAKRLAKGPELPPWIDDAPIHRTFLENVNKALKTSIELPKTELTAAIFRRGMELLRTSMPYHASLIEQVFNHWTNEEKPLREAIRIDRRKTELALAKLSGNIEKISAKEREIADAIQSKVSKFTPEEMAHNPKEMVVTKCINCVGASMLGGALMSEAGLTYVVGQVPRHSILFLVTADGTVEWRDMLAPRFNETLQDRMIAGKNADGSPLTVADIVAFAKHPSPKGLLFDMPGEAYRKKLPWVKRGERQFLGLFGPEYGQKIQVLTNIGYILDDLGLFKQAVEAYHQAIALDPQNSWSYNNLGVALENLGRINEAITVYRRAISIDPQFSNPYNGLGTAFAALGRKKEAIDAYRRFIVLATQEGRYEEWVKRAEQKIKELESNVR